MYEGVHSKYLRSWAVSECLTQIRADDSFTHCISIGPVSEELGDILVYMYTVLYIDIQGDSDVSTLACRWTSIISF